jgi:hypothetical protein
MLSLGAFILGAALLAVMPLVYLFLALSGSRDTNLPGTLIILTSTGGMILVVIGAALRE